MYSYIVAPFLKSLRALRLYVERIEPVIDMNDLGNQDEISNKSFYAILLRTLIKVREIGGDFEKLEIVKSQDDEEVQKNVMELVEKLNSLIYVKNIDGHTSYSYRYLPTDIKREYQIIESQEKQNEILYSGSLMLLITYFENLISKIFYKDFSMHPQRISLNTKCVSYKILEDIGNINDIKNHLIEEEVTAMMYKSFADWISYFQNNMKLKLSYMDINYKIINEIIARRNLFVHNDGVVNTIYLNKVGEGCTLNKGDIVNIERAYIDNAINIIESTGISIIIEIWLKEYGKDEDEIDKIMDLVFEEYLIQEKWEVAKFLYETILEYKNLSIADQYLCKINRALCYKWLNKYDEVKDEIDKLDLSAAQPQYKLAVLTLNDKFEEFFVEYDKQNEIIEKNLKEWPLFIELRNSLEYKKRFSDVDELKEKTSNEITSNEEKVLITDETSTSNTSELTED